MARQAVEIDARSARLRGTMEVPDGGSGLVLFAHGSGSSRHSLRNREVAAAVRAGGIGTLLFDLLTVEEEAHDQYTGHYRFNVELMGERLAEATEWALRRTDARGMPIGYFGASTGAAAALIAAAQLDDQVAAVVSRGGRPDLAGSALPHVSAPTLLIAGERDPHVLELNREAYGQMFCTRQLVTLPGATHLFEEPGALEKVAELAVEWFQKHLRIEGRRSGSSRQSLRHPPTH
jgi:pimeloyl-ACP methyl ester carboxylesterase